MTAEPQPGSREPIAARVAILTAIHGLLVLMVRSAEGTSLSLFLGHLGVEKLPWTFLAVSLVDLPLAFVFMRLARAVPGRVLLSALALGLAACLGGARFLSSASPGAGLFSAYLVATVFNTFLMIQWGVVILDYFTIEESRTAFPVIYAGAQAGGFLAGLALRHLARPLGSENVLLVVPSAAALLAVALTAAAGRLREGRSLRQGESPPHGRSRIGLLRSSPLIRAIALATALMVLLRLAMRYCYGAGFAAHFDSPDDLTAFIGTYTMVASAAAIALQVLATPALLRRLGVATMNLAYSAALALAFVATSLYPGLLASVAGRFADTDLKGAVKTPLSAIFYEAIDPADRSDARAIILGIVSPVASIVSSLALVAVAEGGVPASWIAWAGMALSLAYLTVSFVQGRAYDRALADLLLGWFRSRGPGGEITVEKAVKEGLASPDRRVSDMAREVSRRIPS